MQFKIHQIDRVGSTNSYALEYCKNKELTDGLVFMANEQFEGRGYHNNIWQSEAGKNLTFSMIFKQAVVSPSRQFVITQFISLAILDLLKELIGTNQSLKIKWPNDIYINNFKVCGILVQNTIVGDKFDFSIVGIGLNVNQMRFSTDIPNPASICHFTSKTFDLNELLDKLLNCIAKRYSKLSESSNFKTFEKQYLDNLYRYEEDSKFKEQNVAFNGRIVGIGEFGELKIAHEDGFIKQYNFKEIEFVI